MKLKERWTRLGQMHHIPIILIIGYAKFWIQISVEMYDEWGELFRGWAGEDDEWGWCMLGMGLVCHRLRGGCDLARWRGNVNKWDSTVLHTQLGTLGCRCRWYQIRKTLMFTFDTMMSLEYGFVKEFTVWGLLKGHPLFPLILWYLSESSEIQKSITPTSALAQRTVASLLMGICWKSAFGCG